MLTQQVALKGRGTLAGYLTPEEVHQTVAAGLSEMPLAGRRVLVIIPDGTRTMPMPQMFRVLEAELGPRVQALDWLIAAGTHAPMTDSQLSRHIGCEVRGGEILSGHPGTRRIYNRRIFNHQWDDPSTFEQLGVISAGEIGNLTRGLLHEDVRVVVNRLILDYDCILICGPVFPHEVVGFSGGGKYFFPGIAGPEIIHFTHWLGRW